VRQKSATISPITVGLPMKLRAPKTKNIGIAYRSQVGMYRIISYQTFRFTMVLNLTSMLDFVRVINLHIIRTTPPSRPDKVGLKCPSVRPYVRPSLRPSTKSFFDFNEIWYVGRGRRVMHYGMHSVWPDPRSRSRSRATDSRNSVIFKG